MNSSRREPKGWHSRGYLPHLDVPGLLQSVTFHLGDSLPRNAVEQMYACTKPDDPERVRRIERYLDAGHGACWLGRPDLACLVEDALLHFDGAKLEILYVERGKPTAGTQRRLLGTGLLRPLHP